MMEKLCLALFVLCLGLADGYSRFKREIPNGYGVQHPCPGKGHWDAVGHMSGGYTPRKNIFGENFRDGGKTWTMELCRQDSDGDGLTNGEELGDPQCKWRPGEPAPGPVRGHPGFCEPDRAKCDSGMTHPECPNPNANGARSGSGAPRQLPTGANDHPQTFLSKNMQQGGGQSFGQSFGQSDFGQMGSFGGAGGMSSGDFGGSFGMQSGGFDFPQGDMFTRGPSDFGSRDRFGQSSGGFSGSFGGGMSRDFGLSDSQFLGPQGSMGDTSFQGGFTMSPDMGRFRSGGGGSSMPRMDSRFGGGMGGGDMGGMGRGDMSSSFSGGMGPSFTSSPFMGRGGPSFGGPGMSGGPMMGPFRPF